LLSYCGASSSVLKITEQPATIKYDTECIIIPGIGADNVLYLTNGDEVTLTCYKDDGDLILDDT